MENVPRSVYDKLVKTDRNPADTAKSQPETR